MALSEFYVSTIIEVKANFMFDEFDCDPDEVTSALGIEPDDMRRKGDKRSLPGGKEMKIRCNSWMIISKSTSKDINDHIRELLEKLKGKRALMETRFGCPHLNVIWKGNYLYAGSGPFYEPDVIKGIAEFGAYLWQDIYQVDQAEDE